VVSGALRRLLPLLAALLACCSGSDEVVAPIDGPYVVLLGVAQDGGYPQAACREDCCAAAWEDPARRREVVSLGIVDPEGPERWLIDATPSFPAQLRMLDRFDPPPGGHGISGIFLTHAHVGHYAGLIHLGREAMGAWEVPVYAMPRMRRFLADSGPWDQLVRLKNIDLRSLAAGKPVALNGRITVTPIRVPHREEYTEAIGFRIAGPERAILYLPDIDKWDRWSTPIEEALAQVDVAYLDGTFYADGELAGRDMSQIPHPFIAETMERLAHLDASERAKVRFLHLNHTNPALDPASPESLAIAAAGFRVAVQGERVAL
jgi:pyrroloquinoline quinone biosynthesis protein B